MKNIINNVKTTTFMYEPESLVHVHDWSLAFTPGFIFWSFSSSLLSKEKYQLDDDGFNKLKQLLNNT